MVGGKPMRRITLNEIQLIFALQMIAPVLVGGLGIQNLPAALSIIWTVVVFPNTCKLMHVFRRSLG